MKTKIFAYKGHVAAVTDLKEGVFLNKPLEAGQLGCVVHTTEAEITQEAKDAIKQNHHREGGSFASMMLTKHADGSGSSIGLMGHGKHYFGTNPDIGRDCDLSVLDDIAVVEMEVPADYKEFIDGQ